MITPEEKQKLEIDLPKKYAKIIEQKLIDDDVTKLNGSYYTRNDVSRVFRGIIKDNIVIEKYLFDLALDCKTQRLQRKLSASKLMKH